jgi:hypothetical protein
VEEVTPTGLVAAFGLEPTEDADVLPAERAGELLDALLGEDPGLAPLYLSKAA